MKKFNIGSRMVGEGHPVLMVAEMSGNHGHDYDKAARIVEAAAEAGADAIKLQTYTPDTMTIDSNQSWFRIGPGSLWAGKTLYQLYQEAYTPWDWQPRLKELAESLGLIFFSTPFDETAVDFLEQMQVPVYKLASFEVPHLPLIGRIAATTKPMIMSTGMADRGEIEEAVDTFRKGGGEHLALLHCISSYPARPEDMNLNTIPHLADAFDVVAGLSDHSLSESVSIAAVALGALIIEKHFTISRDEPGPDTAFSLEPQEFKRLVQSVREVEAALGGIRHGPGETEVNNIALRRSIFVVKDMAKGEVFTETNLGIIRPGQGIAPKYYKSIIGKRAVRPIDRGTPISWELLQKED